jgi:hypothetical protein
MVADLQATSERYAAHLAEMEAKPRQAIEPFVLRTEFRIFSPIETSIAHLRDVLFDRMYSDDFMLSTYQLLAQAIGNGQDTLAQLNAMIGDFRNAPPGATAEVVRLYLGLPRPDGPADERYPNLVKGLAVQTDDVIAFGKVLAEHLAEHAATLAKAYGKGAPKTGRADFSRAAKLGLMPDLAEYSELFSALRGEGPRATDATAARMKR